MTSLEAASIRISRRSYIPEFISAEKKEALNKIIADIRTRSGLNIELMEDGENCFSLIKSYGMFSGVKSYFAFAGDRNDPKMREKIGYFGEELILEATRLGLGTCWVGASYSKNSSAFKPAENEDFVCVVSVGEVGEKTAKEKALEKAIKTKRKSPAEMSKVIGEAPEWFKKGVECAANAPSARNKQPVIFEYDGENAFAFSSENAGYNQIDLGIAEYHFEIGSGRRITDF